MSSKLSNILLGNNERFAVELAFSSNSSECVKFFYWIAGKKIGDGVDVDISDVASAFLLLGYGVQDSNLMFECEQDVCLSYFNLIPKGGVPLSFSMMDEIMKCNLWFHHCLGDYFIYGSGRGASVRLFCAPLCNEGWVLDRVFDKSAINDVLISTAAVLNDLADRRPLAAATSE